MENKIFCPICGNELTIWQRPEPFATCKKCTIGGSVDLWKYTILLKEELKNKK